MRTFNFQTAQIHGGHTPDAETLSGAVPLYQTASYVFRNSEHGANLFSLREFGNIYSRLTNPTTEIFEKRITLLEGGLASLAVASGHAAQFLTISALVQPGQNLVSSPFLYGGTFNQFKNTFRQLGIESRFAKSIDVNDFESLIDDQTRVIYIESIGNPSFAVPDFEKFARLSERYDIPLVVDNTFGAGGYLIRPAKYGAAIVVQSATKWICGNGTSIGGVITDCGNYNWASGKFPQFTEPSEGYHGLTFFELFGNLSFILKTRVEGLRDFGPCVSPYNSLQFIHGLETLSLRVEKHVENTLQLAEWLQAHPKVKDVQYPGLRNHPSYVNATKYLQHGYGGVLSFEIEGTFDQTVQFVDALKLVSHMANVGDVKTLIIQPSATTHQQLSDYEQSLSGVSKTLLRVSVGIEYIDDIIFDFEQAFEHVFQES